MHWKENRTVSLLFRQSDAPLRTLVFCSRSKEHEGEGMPRIKSMRHRESARREILAPGIAYAKTDAAASARYRGMQLFLFWGARRMTDIGSFKCAFAILSGMRAIHSFNEMSR
jgi:hypothetical protein